MIDWAVAERRLPGEDSSGDAYVVEAFDGGVLVGVIDGLGHGQEAAAAAAAAVACLRARAGEDVDSLLKGCHEGLRRTRGVAMTLAVFGPGRDTMTWAGVGDVEATLIRHEGKDLPARDSVMLRGGIVGYRLPPITSRTVPLSPGDTLVMVTDGIRSGFVEAIGEPGAPRSLADRIISAYWRETDDALVLVARYVGHDLGEPRGAR